MGWSPGEIKILSSNIPGVGEEMHIDGMRGHRRVVLYLGTAEGLVPEFSLSEEEARKLGQHLLLVAERDDD